MSHAARNWNLVWGVSGAELLAAWKRRALSSPLTLRVNAEGRRKNAERGMAPVQPAVFILHSTFCILHFHSWGEGELGRWTDAATQNCGGGFLTLKCWAKGQRQAGSLARQSQAGGLRYFGLAPVRFSTGLCPRSATRTHYRWGWPPLPAFPRVARGSQPFGTESLWDSGENLQRFGLEVWDRVHYGQYYPSVRPNTNGFAIGDWRREAMAGTQSQIEDQSVNP